ncbi:MAG: Fic family protein [Clostridiales bacterium]|nr:Fic family protein [Clostridiales bacterium]
MDAKLFAAILADKDLQDLRKIKYKYPQADLKEFAELLQISLCRELPLADFSGHPLVYLPGKTGLTAGASKLLLQPRYGSEGFGRKAMEREIASTFTIENVDFTRESVRKIVKGFAPETEEECRIQGMKLGLEFISDPENKITEENLYCLYQMAVEPSLEGENRLLPGRKYRHDSVFVVGRGVEHAGLSAEKLPEAMGALVRFAAEEDGMDDLLKGAVLHFYLAYLHPYFDGNGRMARLLHLWFLVQKGYPSALFVPLSAYVQQSRSGYYKAYRLAEQNAELSGMLDVTPFLQYFCESVYGRLQDAQPREESLREAEEAYLQGTVTAKERDLWNFVLQEYGTDEFSTKQLENDFGKAAYATIYAFVHKFTDLELLEKRAGSARPRYRVR